MFAPDPISATGSASSHIGSQALPSAVITHTSPAGREGPVFSQHDIVDQAIERLEWLQPNFVKAQREKLEQVVLWAVAYEAEINNTLIRNASPQDMSGSIHERRHRALAMSGSHELIEAIRREVQAHETKPDPYSGSVKSHEQLAEQASQRLAELTTPLSSEELKDFHSSILWALAMETETNNLFLQDGEGKEIRDCLLHRIRPALVVTHANGETIRECINTKFWTEWFPGLDNDHRTLREVYNTLPGFPPEKVPAIVRKYENPESPDALPGAVSLLRHDLIHILLGRGLLDQDEAFVIGFTMGTAKEGLTEKHVGKFKAILHAKYPEPYRIAEEDLIAFDLGVRTGREMGIKDLYKFPIEDFMDLTIGEMREKLGISTARLREIYREEASLIPNTLETARLPI